MSHHLTPKRPIDHFLVNACFFWAAPDKKELSIYFFVIENQVYFQLNLESCEFKLNSTKEKFSKTKTSIFASVVKFTIYRN